MEYAKERVPSRGAPSAAINAPEAPSAKIQAPKKHQYSNIKSRGSAWSLEFGVSLELGAWDLELT
jgi:hypothetical protein